MNKFFNKLFLTTLTSSMLCSCMVGPDFEKPKSDLPDAWNEKVTGKLLTDADSVEKLPPEQLAQWWEIFGDKQLTSLIERAFESNLTLAVATAKIQQARSTLGITQSGFFPSLNLNAGMTEGGKTIDTSATSYSMGSSAAWEVDIFGGTRRGIESSLASYRGSLADKCAIRMLVASEVAQTYFQYRATQQILLITKSNLELQRKTYKITEQRKANGFVSLLDVVRAAASVDSTQSQIPTLEAELASYLHNLEFLLAVPTGSLKAELAQDKDLPELEKFIPLGVPAKLIERRPDIMVAEYKLRSAVASVGVAEADFYPKFFINGSISYAAPKIGNIADSQYGSWSVGPSATWNIFQAGKTVFNVQLQEGIVAQRGAEWKSTVLTAMKEVEDAIVSASKERERITYINTLVENNKKAFELSTTLYTEGQIEFLDLLESQRSMLTSEQTQISSRRLFISNLINLYKALGGGWSEENLKDETNMTNWLLFKNSFGMGNNIEDSKN